MSADPKIPNYLMRSQVERKMAEREKIASSNLHKVKVKFVDVDIR